MEAKSSAHQPRFLPEKHNHARCISRALSQAQNHCSRNEVRFTATRRRVLEIIWQNHCPLGAYAILEILVGEGRSCAPPTVYRALDFLLEQGLVHRIASLNAFVGCMHPGHVSTGQFLICESCGTATELDDVRVEKAISRGADSVGFRARVHTIEVAGVCPNCVD